MKISIIAGSHRKVSESERVARYLETNLNKLGTSSTYLFSLASNPLPFWDEEIWENSEKWKTVWGPISKNLQESDGFVIVSPEWSGMVPAGLKNFFLLCGSNELAHKPALIVTVSSGIGGSYPVNELRTSSYKNTRICYIPDHIIVRKAPEMLKAGEPTSSHDEQLRKRINYSLKLLIEYSNAFKPIRENKLIDYKNFPFGM